jgi:hypothetical protein
VSRGYIKKVAGCGQGSAFALLLAALFAACAPTPTPFPVDIPQAATATLTPNAAQPIRYVLAANTDGFVADLALIQSSAKVEQLSDPINPSDLGSRYDLVAAYGDWSGWTRAPAPLHVSLLLNASIAPLNDGLVANIVRHCIDPQAVLAALNIPGAAANAAETSAPAALKTELANQGYPDGFELTLAYAYTPGVTQIADQLRRVNIDTAPDLMSDNEVQAALDAKWLNLALIAWITSEQRQVWVSRVGEANVIDLYTLPVSYLALPELNITFTPGGFPLAHR